MKFSVLSALTLLAASVLATPAPGPKPKPPKPCTLNFKGSAKKLEEAQQAAMAHFADLFLVHKDIQTAFDLYVPDEYINHNPGAQTGRQPALDVLIPFLQNPALTYDVKAVFAGQGYGVLHYRMTIPGVFDFAVMDRYRFVGTCIVEHWDVAQRITGTESNPIAFF